ncbi:MAG: CPBP family glutamic-type intramembrane protease [Planctomycetota bacterium]|jgi:membrane protease YdiL (CAAX protease family)
MPSKSSHPPNLHEQRYIHQARQPLYALLFVAPLILIFHSGVLIKDIQSLYAHRHLAAVFRFVGVTGPYLPTAALVTVLAIQHLAGGHRWRGRPAVLGIMVIECLLWTLPLTAMRRLMGQLAAGEATSDLSTDLLLSVGAGIYEEFLFRLLGIGLMILLFADVFGLPKRWVTAAALVVTAVVFGLYHPQAWHGQEVFAGGLHWRTFGFLTSAGAYLGALMLLRGFGIVVGTHVLYNVCTLLLPA